MWSKCHVKVYNDIILVVAFFSVETDTIFTIPKQKRFIEPRQILHKQKPQYRIVYCDKP